MLRFNNGNQALTCDSCNVMVVAGYVPGGEWMTTYRPTWFERDGRHFCSEKCAAKGEASERLAEMCEGLGGEDG